MERDRRQLPLGDAARVSLAVGWPLPSSLSSARVRGAADESGDGRWLQSKRLSHEAASFNVCKVHILRLQPSEDLLECMFAYARVLDVGALSVVSVVGSLQSTNIRYANNSEGVVRHGAFEIVSMTGNGSGHLHLAVSDGRGMVTGGHAMTGNVVYTTAEVTTVELVHGRFARHMDPLPAGSGYRELKVYHDDADQDQDQEES